MATAARNCYWLALELTVTNCQPSTKANHCQMDTEGRQGRPTAIG